MNKNDLKHFESSYPLQFPERLYRPFTEKLIGLEGRLIRSGQDITKRDELKLARSLGTLASNSPIQQVSNLEK